MQKQNTRSPIGINSIHSEDPVASFVLDLSEGWNPLAD
jgi:hypothetical protein